VVEETRYALEVESLDVWFGSRHVLKGLRELRIPRSCIFAIMGPSGSGKSTLLKVFNRLLELNPDARVEGRVLLFGQDIFSMDVIELRRKVGMVFQQPNPFPHMSVYDNVAYALKANGLVRDRRELDEAVKEALVKANLWEEVKDQLKLPAARLSGGQQQRLVLARALALKPNVILLDEPTSMIDVVGARRIEETLVELKAELTVVVVSHDPHQAARLSDYVGFLYDGRLIECGPTKRVFEAPQHELTERYVIGRLV
jgi:phosphate transport system ATP-binding protein